MGSLSGAELSTFLSQWLDTGLECCHELVVVLVFREHAREADRAEIESPKVGIHEFEERQEALKLVAVVLVELGFEQIGACFQSFTESDECSGGQVGDEWVPEKRHHTQSTLGLLFGRFKSKLEVLNF